MAHLRTAVIGCGGISREHLEGYRSHPATELVAVAEIDEQRLAEVGRSHDVDRLYRDYREMLERERPDIVSICTSASLHHDMTLAAAAVGAHVLCEKPIASDLREADAMIAACDRAGVRLAVNHQQRCSPTFARAAALIEAGEIGSLRAIRDRGKHRHGGYEMMEIGTHLFDAMRFFAGEVRTVTGRLVSEGRPTEAGDIRPSQEVEPGYRPIGPIAGEDAFAYFEFEGGINGAAEFYRNPVPIPSSGPRFLMGTEGILALRTAPNWGIELHHYPAPIYDHTRPERWRQIELAPEELDMRGLTPPPNKIVRSIDEMVRCLEEDREHLCSGRDGRAALEMVHAVFASHFAGATRTLPLAERRHPLELALEAAPTTGRPT